MQVFARLLVVQLNVMFLHVAISTVIGSHRYLRRIFSMASQVDTVPLLVSFRDHFRVSRVLSRIFVTNQKQVSLLQNEIGTRAHVYRGIGYR